MWYDATRGSVGNQIQFPVDVTIITARKRSLRRLCFYTCGSVYGGGGGGLHGRGVCVAGSMCGRDGHACQGVCVWQGGMHGRGVQGGGQGHAWLGGHVWQGEACVP